MVFLSKGKEEEGGGKSSGGGFGLPGSPPAPRPTGFRPAVRRLAAPVRRVIPNRSRLQQRSVMKPINKEPIVSIQNNAPKLSEKQTVKKEETSKTKTQTFDKKQVSNFNMNARSRVPQIKPMPKKFSRKSASKSSGSVWADLKKISEN